jgi:hypothetical protein
MRWRMSRVERAFWGRLLIQYFHIYRVMEL